jgi:hypothetical protein
LTPHGKARLVGSIVLAIALWPIAHRQLVVHMDVNPWKLYGFAMYCTPHDVVVDVIDRSGAAPQRIDPAAFPAPLRATYESFTARRGVLGRFVSPDALAADAFAALPELRALTVAVSVFSLERGEASITRRTRLYAFERGAIQ